MKEFKLKQGLIEQLRRGERQIDNHSNPDIELLRTILKTAFPDDRETCHAGYRYYRKNGEGRWKGFDEQKEHVPVVKLTDFLSEEEFVLPEKWVVRRTPENRDVLCSWLNQTRKENEGIYDGDTGWVSNSNIDRHSLPRVRYGDCPEGYVEISFEDFKKHVLKQGDSGKIIGYKCPMDLFECHVKAGTVFKKIRPEHTCYFPNGDIHSDFQLPKEIVETWEKVYEAEVQFKEVTLGNSHRVKIGSDGSIKGTRKYSITAWEDLRDYLKGTELICNNHTGNYPVVVQTFQIGCVENVKPSQIQDLISVYYSLNKKQ